MHSRRDLLIMGAAAGAMAVGPARAADPLKIGFVYNSPVGDAGWTFQHDQGRLAVEAALAGQVATTKVESVTEEGVEGVLRQLVETGHGLIFTTSFGFMNPTIKVAGDNPGVVFEHATGYKLADNVGTYQARDYEARYLSGVVAGKMSRSNIAGFIASVPIPEVVRGINAFTLGMRSVNPAASVKVVWLNSWYDPGREREAADALITQGVDVINQFTDSGAPTQAAEARGVWSISVGSDRSAYGPKAHLTSVIYTWGDFYSDVARRVMAGGWKSEAVWGGLAAGMTDISPLNAAVPAEVAELVAARKAEIVASKRHPFEGPIIDQAGALKLPEGATMSDEELLGMAWFVEGVEGTIPQ